MVNRLAAEMSPCLLEHADNPVDWWPWSPEAFAGARRRDLPVPLSIGYSSCHRCRVMVSVFPTVEVVLTETPAHPRTRGDPRTGVLLIFPDGSTG